MTKRPTSTFGKFATMSSTGFAINSSTNNNWFVLLYVVCHFCSQFSSWWSSVNYVKTLIKEEVISYFSPRISIWSPNQLSEFLWTLEILLILTATIQFIDQETLRSENINRFRLPSKEGMEALFQEPYHVSKSYIFLLIVCEADLEILMLSVPSSVVMLKKGC